MTNFNKAEAAGGKYRADIDGLRAVAVLPVVFYHFQVKPFTGGFVGVDVFFVISGFLITRLIWSEMREGHFSLISFYERRIRRIFPALFAMIAAAVIAGFFLLFPHTLLRFGISLIATAGFVSNFHFWGEAGYWAADAVDKPLLHTWSLAVEEQYYLLFPGFLYLLRGSRTNFVLGVLIATLLISLVLSIVGVYYAPISTFYLLPTRLWELLIGGVLAVGQFPALGNAMLRNAVSALGLALIAWSIFALMPSSPFPGANAIPPCLGAALIIYAGSRGEITWINGALASRLPVFFGLISYSLYLWHWPIFVMAEAALPKGLTALQTALGIAASIGLGYLSWRYIESPFRGHNSPIGRKPLFVMAGAAICLAVAVGFVLSSARGFPQRYDPATQLILAGVDDHEPQRSHCFDLSPSKVKEDTLCKIGFAGAPVTFLLWGDSHADAMMPAVSDAAAKEHKAGLVAAHGHCTPMIGVSFLERVCRSFNAAAMKIAMGRNIDTVVLDSRWASPAGEPPIGPADWDDEDKSATVGKRSDRRGIFAAALTRTVNMLTAAHKRVILVGPVPEFHHSVPVELAKMRVWGGNWQIAPTRQSYLARQAFVYSTFETLAKSPQVRIVRVDTILCPSARCLTIVDGRPLYRDTNHVSVFATHMLTPLFASLL